MSSKTIAHKAQAARKYLGRAPAASAAHRGTLDQFTGNTKQAGDKVEVAFKH